tara:strand:- start:253 stop:726 length:474 start_codon:yes stop_codon:yes gene_type:complete
MKDFNRKKIALLIGFSFSLLLVSVSHGEKYDFHINFDSCKTLIGYLVQSNESLKVLEGSPYVLSCKRDSTDVTCFTQFLGGGKSIKKDTNTYQILIDSPPRLIFSDSNRSDYFVIDTAQHSATSITRVLDTKYAASKVCQGLYVTSFELKELNKTNQ